MEDESLVHAALEYRGNELGALECSLSQAPSSAPRLFDTTTSLDCITIRPFFLPTRAIPVPKTLHFIALGCTQLPFQKTKRPAWK